MKNNLKIIEMLVGVKPFSSVYIGRNLMILLAYIPGNAGIECYI